MKKNKVKIFVGNWGHENPKNRKSTMITDSDYNIEFKKIFEEILKQNNLDLNSLSDNKKKIIEEMADEEVRINQFDLEWLDYFDRKDRGADKIRNLERQKIYAKKNPAKIETQAKLRYAASIGKIKKPNICSSCGLFFPLRRIQAHHDDYNKPFEVRWLCPYCHRLIHHFKSF